MLTGNIKLIVGLLDILFRSSLSVLTDLNINKASLDTSLFPGAPSDAQVHQGFRDAHKATANTILGEVTDLISSSGATSVVVVSLPSGFLVGCTHPLSYSGRALPRGSSC